MYKEQIDRYLESKTEAMLEDLKELVRIDSQRTEAKEGMPYGEGPAKALDAATRIMEKYGLKVTDYDHRVVAGDFGPAEKELDILAHLDVVPVTDEWTVTKPFEPLVKDGRIYGRGTADDKGPAIAALYAILAIKDLGLPLKKGVRLLLGSDEECGSSDLAYYYEKEEEAPCTFSPDADFPLINVEKARLAGPFTASYARTEEESGVVLLEGGDKVNVVPAKAKIVLKGVDPDVLENACKETAHLTGCQFTVEGNTVHVKGTSAHGSMPECGNNALTAALKLVCSLPLPKTEGLDLLQGIAKLFSHGDTIGEALGIVMEDDISGKLTMNLGVLHYGEGILRGELDCRAPVCANDENLTIPVKQALAAYGITFENELTEAHYVPEDLPFVQILLGSYERYTGKEGKALSTGGGTYVHHLKRGVAFGCMSEEVDNHMHGDDEFMEIDTMVMSAKIFADVIMKICG